MCGIDIETTGKQPGYHEIIQIGLLPLDQNLEPRKDLPVFDFRIKPLHLDRVDPKALKISKTQYCDILDTGFHPDVVKSQFYNWFEKLKLGEDKKIVPLGHFISIFDIPFLIDWLSWETYQFYFHGHIRDTSVICAYLNDRAEFHAEQTPFPKLSATEMAKKLEISVIEEHSHDALYDAYIGAQCYKKLLTKFIDHI